MTASPKARILFVVSEDWYALSHRLPMARAAQAAGLDVVFATRDNGRIGELKALGMRVYPISMDRTGLNPIKDAKVYYELLEIMRRERPTIVHNVALKPVLYGSLAASRSPGTKIINVIAGFGFLFVSNKLKARLLRPIIRRGLAWAFAQPDTTVILQNEEAKDFAVNTNLAPLDKIIVVPGSGVDVEHFQPLKVPDGPVTFAFVGRMLKSKGLLDIIAAQKILRDRGPITPVLLAGKPDINNPDSVTINDLETWQSEGLITWLGHVDDVRTVWARAHVALLPSWGEGLPKSLLEACACGRPAITSNHTGCKELIRDGIDGLLIPDRSPLALADAMQTLANDPKSRKQHGLSARDWIVERFSNQVVEAEVQAIYHDLLGSSS